jgi:hypothetical protein
MLVSAVTLWKEEYANKNTQELDTSEWRLKLMTVNICQLWFNFSPSLSDIWLGRKKQRETSVKIFVM